MKKLGQGIDESGNNYIVMLTSREYRILYDLGMALGKLDPYKEYMTDEAWEITFDFIAKIALALSPGEIPPYEDNKLGEVNISMTINKEKQIVLAGGDDE